MPDPKFVKVVSFGHRSTAADVVWLSSLPNMSRSEEEAERRARKQKWLDSVLATVTALEPSFVTAYAYGSDYLWLANRRFDASTDLLERGVRANPDSLYLLVKLGMAYFQAGRRDDALRVLLRASEHPDCDGMTRSMCAALQVDDREDEAALYAFVPQMESAPNELMRELAERDFETVRRKIVARARKQFEEREGRPATRLDDLRDPTLMQEAVLDLVLDPEKVTLSADGFARFPRLEELDLLHRIRVVNNWVDASYSENGVFPTLEEMLTNPWGPPGPPPAGKRWDVQEHRLVLVDDPESGDAGAE